MGERAQRKTIKQLCDQYQTGERNFYKSQELGRKRPDLREKVAAGELSLHAAWMEMRGIAPPDGFDRFVTVWKGATIEERGRIIAWVWQHFPEEEAE